MCRCFFSSIWGRPSQWYHARLCIVFFLFIFTRRFPFLFFLFFFKIKKLVREMLRPKIVRKNLLRGETRDIICVDSFDDGRTSSLSFFPFYFSSSPLWLLFKRECESIPLSVSIEMRCDLLLLLLRLANDATVQISFPFIFISLTIEERTALSLIVINLITPIDWDGWVGWLRLNFYFQPKRNLHWRNIFVDDDEIIRCERRCKPKKGGARANEKDEKKNENLFFIFIL